ncbi:MAG: nicotinate phosphoribosyltransferase, partial [Sulfurihydrogenibium sp.]|nr:nicotinate phosphoribosyltransferase [Sulfurihydrogenibium sp.]
MKVKDYVETGLKNFVEVIPADYKEVGKCKSGCHVVSFYAKEENGKIADVKFNSSKRCKKLLAVADYITEIIKQKGEVEFKDEEVLDFFKDEKEIEKVKDRLEIV